MINERDHVDDISQKIKYRNDLDRCDVESIFYVKRTTNK